MERLASVPIHRSSLGVVLERVADLAHATVPAADQVSVTLIQGSDTERGPCPTHGMAFSAASDATVALDERQYRGDHGPCREAAMHARTISVADTALERRYRDFCRQASRAGVRSVLAMGLPAGANTRVALGWYTRADHSFATSEMIRARRFATGAAAVLANAAAYWASVAEVTQMREAMASRALIEQAKGIIISHRGCTPDDAFEFLRGISSRTNTKVRDVAWNILAAAVDDRRKPMALGRRHSEAAGEHEADHAYNVVRGLESGDLRQAR
jgi:hypothetical protein